MKTFRLTLSALLALSCAAAIAAPTSDEALERMRSMKTTGQSLDMKTIAQDGPTADAIRENLKRIKLPEGFRIDLYAVVPDARHMAVGPSSGVVFVGTRKTDLWAVTDRTKNRTADEVKRFAPAISFTQPGPCSARTAFSSSPSTTACWCSRPPSSSTRGRTWRRTSWCRPAS